MQTENLITIIGIIALTTMIFWACREVVCWYWKMNESVKNQKEQIRLLKKIAGEEEIEEEVKKEEDHKEKTDW